MEKTSQRERPPYFINSVDRCLRLIQMLRDQGQFRLTDAAAELAVAPSTAHQLLSMLTYRGFAVQDENRTYHSGPSLNAAPARIAWTRRLRDLAGPHLDLLCSRVDETVSLMIRVGTRVRFLDTVETRQVLRIGDREGAVLPARLASGGKALLAHLPMDALLHLYRDPRAALSGELLDEAEFNRLVRGRYTVRQ